jgi:uncharacterized protein (TIGR02118 family)
MPNFYKRFGLLRRRPDLTHEQFVAYWTTVHGEMAKGLPKLRRYVINVVDRNRSLDFGYDGMSELWFDSVADHDAAFAAPLGVELLADLKNFALPGTPVIVEERRMLWPCALAVAAATPMREIS